MKPTKRAWIMSGVALACALPACDAIIGIEELSTTPPVNNGVACATPADCPPAGNPCFLRACTSQGICELRDVQGGFVVEVQTPGDCISVVCQSGNATDTFDATDVVDDGNLCTIETCVEGEGTQSVPAGVGTDCGGMVCDGAGNCVECNTPNDCTGTQICQSNHCVAATCNDNQMNGTETDEDCGGQCLPCDNGKDCLVNGDCKSGVCDSGDTNKCLAPACDDGVMNGNETDKDCGGNCPDGCGLGKLCENASDCDPALNYCVCMDDTCTCETPACNDGVKNGTEIEIDCGPGCAGEFSCLDGMPCLDNDWCQSLVCDTGEQVCLAPTCTDGVANGDEGGVDCDCPIAPIAGCPDCEASACGG